MSQFLERGYTGKNNVIIFPFEKFAEKNHVLGNKLVVPNVYTLRHPDSIK
jgi:hypothetical protein